MKKTIKLAVVAALALGATSAFATNGDIMIGQGAKSRAMGGVGIATSFGAESGLANPAMINSVENMEVTAAATFFMPSVSFNSNAAGAAQGYPMPAAVDSAADFSVIPEIAFAHRVTDSFVYGVSVTGTAGMGTDYSDVPFGLAGDNGSFQMKTNLQLLKVAVPLAYQVGGFTMAIAPIMQYGSLQMSHQIQSPTDGSFSLLDNGAATDIGYGYEVGFAYEMSGIGAKGLTVGAVAKSAINMTYDDTISASVNAFGGETNTGVSSGDSLNQPAEVGIGISYTIYGGTVALDYKRIQWSKAEGYADFGWEDQSVYAVGYEYAGNGWALRAGANYGKSPVAEQDGNPLTAGNASYSGAVKNFFNLSGFPGIVESHYTLGGGYDITKDFTLDASFIIAPEVTASYDTTGMTAAFMANGTNPPNPANWDGSTSTADVAHSQMAVTIAASYRF